MSQSTRRRKVAVVTNVGAVLDQARRKQHADRVAHMAAAAKQGTRSPGRPTYGLCTACNSIEVRLVVLTGSRDLSTIGESAQYPTGFGCEVCS